MKGMDAGFPQEFPSLFAATRHARLASRGGFVVIYDDAGKAVSHTAFCKPFTTAEIRYFTLEQLDAAHSWLNG